MEDWFGELNEGINLSNAQAKGCVFCQSWSVRQFKRKGLLDNLKENERYNFLRQ
jgi:hypothetical protein